MFSDVLAILLYARKKPENAHELLEGILCLRDFEAKFVLNPSDTFYHQDTFELKTHDTKIALEKLKKYFVKNNPDSLSDMSFEKLQQLAENIAYQGVIEHFKKHGKEQLLKDVISVYQMNHTDMQFDLSSIFTNQKKEHVLSAVESLRAQANNREQCLKKFHNVNP